MDTPWESEMKAAFAAIEKRYAMGGRIREFIDDAVGYHGFPAPAVILGAYMVDLALEKLDAGPDDRLFAVSESAKGLPDAIGALTWCTPGSSKFMLFNTGRLSLAIGKDEGTGRARCIRVYVMHEGTVNYPALRAWYFNDMGENVENSLPLLLDDIVRAGRSILGWERVEVDIPPKDNAWKPAVCPKCGEMLPDKYLEGGLCRACGQGSYIKNH